MRGVDLFKRLIVAVMLLGMVSTPIFAEDMAAEKAKVVPVIAHIRLAGEIGEVPVADPFGLMGGQVGSLKGYLTRFAKAREDDAVKAVLITVGPMSMGYAQLEEIRNAIAKVKAADKPVYVYAEEMNIGLYSLLASGSELAIVPEGMIWLTGLYGESVYMKGLLDKIGVEADFLHMGDYKAAAEPLTRRGPSEEARDNANWLLDGMYGNLVGMIASSREMSEGQVRQLVDDGPYMADQALKLGLVDKIMFRDDFVAYVKNAVGGDAVVENGYGKEQATTVNFASPFAMFSILSEMFKQSTPSDKDAVGIVYVDGAIMTGYGQTSAFGGSSGAYSGSISNALKKVEEDDSVKALVLRVSSPGGSALASEIILDACKKVQMKKPVIVSMGNVAASGGYYVSCSADAIFADKGTITASIGVVGGKLKTTGMWDKLGVDWVGYKRGANADFFSSGDVFSPEQRKILHRYMDDVYETFKGHVIEGRGDKLTKPLAEMAGGRVYTGEQALELGLVDELGGMSEAVAYAAKKVGLDDYEVRVVPEPKDPFVEMMEQLAGEGENPTDVSVKGAISQLLEKQGFGMSYFQALKQIDPKRAAAVMQALTRLNLLQSESVLMMVPEDFVIY